MDKILLRLNWWLFAWYYSRVPEHFKQWTFFQSVRLLISNYVHQGVMMEGERRCHQFTMQEYDKTRRELQRYQWKELEVDDTTTMRLNTMFGTDMPSNSDN